MTEPTAPRRAVPTKRCSICGRVLDVLYDVETTDCGGDCLRCMADAGDWDAVITLALEDYLWKLRNRESIGRHWRAAIAWAGENS